MASPGWDLTAAAKPNTFACPYADFNCLKLPDDAQEKENDYVMLSDIFPTGWHAAELAGVKPGESVVIYGCGPVGLMAAHSAMIKGASKVIVVDSHPDRLALAEKIGAMAIDYSKGSAVEQILELTDREGADRGCECVGHQCHDPAGHGGGAGSQEGRQTPLHRIHRA